MLMIERTISRMVSSTLRMRVTIRNVKGRKMSLHIETKRKVYNFLGKEGTDSESAFTLEANMLSLAFHKHWLSLKKLDLHTDLVRTYIQSLYALNVSFHTAHLDYISDTPRVHRSWRYNNVAPTCIRLGGCKDVCSSNLQVQRVSWDATLPHLLALGWVDAITCSAATCQGRQAG
eukprot:scaffold246611_cov14-Tisochrysis_lutea.AAC.1